MTEKQSPVRHWTDPDDEPQITPENALVVIAHEMRSIRKTLSAMAFDENCETVLAHIHTVLNDTLHALEPDGDGVADILERWSTR
jgi:hypothetical protein